MSGNAAAYNPDSGCTPRQRPIGHSWVPQYLNRPCIQGHLGQMGEARLPRHEGRVLSADAESIVQRAIAVSVELSVTRSQKLLVDAIVAKVSAQLAASVRAEDVEAQADVAREAELPR
eukprot:CAMPEP_0195653024 /NCGR_PEP_ID=MMETSP0815-20121206/33154_1 /TAXON_ID=97485 /ORGANISM="Prymnesium parvum, Strain Texoma1" /LENGTH=117 /DNA_ID=CAMNT_0040797117 /DNA_START=302 /DNA_END=653 /DNA_ORIENTATION=-